MSAAGARARALRLDDLAEVVKLAEGVVVVMGPKSIVASCIECPAFFHSVAEAAAHVEDQRHRIGCDDRTAYTLAPVELFDGVR